MLIAAIDIATNTGFALGQPGEKPRTDLWKLKKPSEHYDVVGGEMGRKIRDLCFLAETRPDLIVFEAPIPPYQNQGGGDRENPIRRSIESILVPQRGVGGLQGVAACYGIEVLPANMQTVRKHFTGKARWGSPEATKRAVIERCRLLGYVGPTFKDDNVCDALALWDWACATRARHVPRDLIMHGERPSAA
ncbi:hypothetical protein [Methylorubrum zatmanii]